MNSNKQKVISRNEDGLINDVNYIFDEFGMVDWRAMIPSDFLYVNPDLKRRDRLEKKYNKAYSEIHPINDNVEDVDLIMTLAATKYLLKLRGYTSVLYNVVCANDNYAAVNCIINFIANYETENRFVNFSENACAHLGNTNGFGNKYLIEMATNRSLARCVRNFLNINIVSKEELGGNNIQEEESKIVTPNPIDILNKLMSEKNISFESIKEENGKNAEAWNNINDIPKSKLFTIIGKIKQSIK